MNVGAKLNKPIATIFGLVATMFMQSAYCSEIWDCHYVHPSHETGPGAPPPLDIRADYMVDKGYLVLTNGTARYRIGANTDFGLAAVRMHVCEFCTGGPLIDTELVAINKLSGDSSLTTVFVSKDAENDFTVDKGKCVKGR